MGTVFGIVLEKGGVGKTTSTQALATEFAKDSTKKVLAIDMDPQGNLTKGFGVQMEEGENSTYEVLLNPDYSVEYAVKSSTAGVDVLPSTKAMAGVEYELVSAISRESKLAQALRDAEGSAEYPVEKQAIDTWDYFFLDSPPNLGILTMNVMVAADILLIPIQVQVYALDAMDQLENTLKLIKKLNRKAQIGGVFCTMFDASTNLSTTIEKEIRSRYGSLVFDTLIPKNTQLAEAPAFGKSIQEYRPKSPGAKAYAALAQEIRERFAL
jgi:chromosome partitioning protein